MALADQTSTRGESHAPRDTTRGPQATPCRRLTLHARSMATSGRLGWGAGGACSTEGAPLPCPRPSPVRPGRRPCPRAAPVLPLHHLGPPCGGWGRPFWSKPTDSGDLRPEDLADKSLPGRFRPGFRRNSAGRIFRQVSRNSRGQFNRQAICMWDLSGDEPHPGVCHPTSGCAAAAC